MENVALKISILSLFLIHVLHGVPVFKTGDLDKAFGKFLPNVVEKPHVDGNGHVIKIDHIDEELANSKDKEELNKLLKEIYDRMILGNNVDIKGTVHQHGMKDNNKKLFHDSGGPTISRKLIIRQMKDFLKKLKRQIYDTRNEDKVLTSSHKQSTENDANQMKDISNEITSSVDDKRFIDMRNRFYDMLDQSDSKRQKLILSGRKDASGNLVGILNSPEEIQSKRNVELEKEKRRVVKLMNYMQGADTFTYKKGRMELNKNSNDEMKALDIAGINEVARKENVKKELESRLFDIANADEHINQKAETFKAKKQASHRNYNHKNIHMNAPRNINRSKRREDMSFVTNKLKLLLEDLIKDEAIYN